MRWTSRPCWARNGAQNVTMTRTVDHRPPLLRIVQTATNVFLHFLLTAAAASGSAVALAGCAAPGSAGAEEPEAAAARVVASSVAAAT
eukprot:6783557-Lingulodinium_polyedra.AAC.1